MQQEIYDAHGESLHSIPLVGHPTATGPDEIRWLISKARAVPGNIAEIGVFRGETTLELASAYPNRTIYAVDLPVTDPHNYQHGKDEQNICALARHLPNVEVLLLGNAFDFSQDRNIGFVFIDGDHTWEGVRRDTEKALRWFRPGMQYHNRNGARQGVVAWHDCSPAWPGNFHMQVHTYLQQLSTHWPIIRVEGTTLAYINL